MDFLKLLSRPSAFAPITMSLLALGLVMFQISLYGITHEPDEGAAAHIFQILIAAQLPVIVLFAVRFIPKEPKNSIAVIGLQILAGLMAVSPVWWFNL